MYPYIDIEATGKNIRKMMKRRGLTIKEVQEYLGMAYKQSIYHWFKGTNLPTIDNLYALSRLFQVPVDSIIVGGPQLGAADQEKELINRLLSYRKHMTAA